MKHSPKTLLNDKFTVGKNLVGRFRSLRPLYVLTDNLGSYYGDVYCPACGTISKQVPSPSKTKQCPSCNKKFSHVSLVAGHFMDKMYVKLNVRPDKQASTMCFGTIEYPAYLAVSRSERDGHLRAIRLVGIHRKLIILYDTDTGTYSKQTWSEKYCTSFNLEKRMTYYMQDFTDSEYKKDELVRVGIDSTCHKCGLHFYNVPDYLCGGIYAGTTPVKRTIRSIFQEYILSDILNEMGLTDLKSYLFAQSDYSNPYAAIAYLRYPVVVRKIFQLFYDQYGTDMKLSGMQDEFWAYLDFQLGFIIWCCKYDRFISKLMSSPTEDLYDQQIECLIDRTFRRNQETYQLIKNNPLAACMLWYTYQLGFRNLDFVSSLITQGKCAQNMYGLSFADNATALGYLLSERTHPVKVFFRHAIRERGEADVVDDILKSSGIVNPDDIIDFRHLLGIYTKLYNNKYDFDSYKKINGVSIYSLPFDTLGDALSTLNS